MLLIPYFDPSLIAHHQIIIILDLHILADIDMVELGVEFLE